MGGKMRPIFLCGVFFVFCAGCGDSGPAVHPVKGKVTKGGAPLSGVLVTFSPVAGGASSTGLTNASGEFALLSASGKSGAIAGKHKVTLTVQETGTAAGGTADWAKMAAERNAQTQGGSQGAPAAPTKKDDKVPPEYTDPNKSPLPEYEVKAGSNEFDIVIP